MTDTRFPELMNSTILSRLALSSTYYPLAPKSSIANAIIPSPISLAEYFVNLRALNAGGAVYSTINDMRAFGKSILNSTLLSPALTRRWLKPHSFAPNSYLAVGAPWEIVSYPPTSMFPVRIYTKSGDVGLYSTNMGMLPDYNVGFTVLTAGVAATVTSRVLSDLVVSAVVPALKQVAASQANETYAGSYGSGETNSTMSLTVTPNEGDVGSALRVDELVYNGTDLIALYAFTLGLQNTNLEVTAEAYSTGLQRRNGGTVLESWRVAFNVRPSSRNSALVSQLGPFTSVCETWAGVDGSSYGGVGIDEILFRREGGNVTGAEVRFLREGFWGKEGGGGQNRKRDEGEVVRDGVKLKRVRVEW